MLIEKVDFVSQKGFAALVSAVLISAAMMILAAFAARAAFWARFDFMARENKKISAARAEGCVHLAFLKIARNEIVAPENCEIVSIGGTNPHEILVRAVYQNAYTNLKVTALLENGKVTVIDWREL